MKAEFFESAAEFRGWLKQHHANTAELVLGFHRKETGCGFTYAEALDEALAFGWIDGVRKRVDGKSYCVRFTPRRAGSVWSAVNTRRAEELIAAGRMAAPGLRAFRERDAEKTRRNADARAQARLDPELETALRANARAAEFFGAQPPGYRKVAVLWVMSAKQSETRARRLARVIECSEQGKRIDPLKPNG